MAPPTRLNTTQLAQVRELIAEEFNNAFNEVIPNVTANIIDQVRALLDERFAAGPLAGGVIPVPPVRDLMYYYEKFGKCSPPHWDGEDDPVAAKHWLSDIEGAFMTIGCPDQFRVLVAKNLLRKNGNSNPNAAASSNGHTMMTRGRVHQLTEEEPAKPATVAGTYLLDFHPAAVMFDSGATHSCVSHSFINRLGRNIGKLARPMVIEVADNRTIYVTDVYRGCTLEFREFNFLSILSLLL